MTLVGVAMISGPFAQSVTGSNGHVSILGLFVGLMSTSATTVGLVYRSKVSIFVASLGVFAWIVLGVIQVLTMAI
jgi:hypothetical protein